MNSLRKMPMLLSSLGFGGAMLWYLFSDKWLAWALPKAIADSAMDGGAMLLPVSFPLAAILALFCIALGRITIRKLMIGALLVMLATVSMLLFLACDPYGSPLDKSVLPIAWAVLSGVIFGLAHVFWIQNLVSRSLRETMVSLSLGLVIAGTAGALLALGDYSHVVWLIASPPISFLAYLLAFLLQNPHSKRHADAQLPRLRTKRNRIPFVAIYAAIMGFATTQFFILVASSAHEEIAAATVALVGVVFLFIGFFLIRLVHITWILFLSAVFFATLILLWFVYPDLADSILGATSSLHWVGFVLIACSAHESRRLTNVESAASTYITLVLFYLASGLGNITIHIGAVSRGLISLTALIILLITFVFARHEKGSIAFAENVALGAPEKQEALKLFAATHGLTPRETDVFILLAEGNSLRHIAETLVLSENTIKRHRSNVYQKTGVSSRQELIDAVRMFSLKD